MFGLTKKITPSSLISSSMYVRGTVRSDSEVYVDGVVEGDVNAKILIIGINGRIKSPSIAAEKIVVHGAVDGNINAISVYLGATAKINGNITHRDISIENGAFISGDLKQRRD
ncbi:MAG: polymer-forming cytoskeletal protein [Rickettsiales bacterium]|jgi:cytoskeletal protein CcmA (bactofilin family)|nr:polymer-forming cytoskeletal protein [Rickettsiales bacterium]